MILLPIIAAALLRIFLILRDSVPFAYDMGRDLLWTKDILFYHTPTLIGPAASIWGVYFPPFWYYFLAIPLFLTNGNPLSAVVVTATTTVLSGFLGYFLFKNYIGKSVAFILLVTILFSSTLINISTFAFHANVLPLLTILFIYYVYKSVVQNLRNFYFACLVVGLMFSADPAPGIVFTLITPILFIIFKIYKRQNVMRTLAISLSAYLLPLTPLVIFELRNQFIQSKSLIQYFLGNNPSLSGQLPLFERIVNRIEIYFGFWKDSFAGGNTIIATLFLIAIILGLAFYLKEKKQKEDYLLFKVTTITFISAFLIYTLIVTVEIKNWYLYGITILFAFFIAFAAKGFQKNKLFLLVFLAIYIAANTVTNVSQKRAIASRNDPAQLSNQMEAIETIYKDIQGPFSIYVYTPVIYDYSYQYLLWWKGIKQKKGLPSDFAYLPNIPDYVRNKTKYAQNPTISDTIYLIIEKNTQNEFYTEENWLKNFNNFKYNWSKEINNASRVEKYNR